MIKKMYNQPGQRSTVNWSTVNGQLTRQRATSASKSASTSAVTQRHVSTRRSSSPARCSGDGRLLRRVFRRRSSSPACFPAKFFR